MTAAEYLLKTKIIDRTLNTEDLSEYQKTLSALMEEYAEIKVKEAADETQFFREMLPIAHDISE